MAHLHEQEKRLGLEIADESSRIKKSKNKMMTAENSKEYNAMVREMDTLERMNRDKELEKDTLIEELANQKSLQEEIEAENQSSSVVEEETLDEDYEMIMKQ